MLANSSSKKPIVVVASPPEGEAEVTGHRENLRFRVHGRHKVALAASVSHALAGWRLDARVSDLSLAGARLSVAGRGLSEGDRVRLSLVAPTLWDPIELTAVVTWQSPEGDATAAGVRFEGQRDEDLLSLFDLLAAGGF